MTPRRILLCVVATHLDGLTRADTVPRAWWRGTTLTRVVLRHGGPRYVVDVTRVASGDFCGLRVRVLDAMDRAGLPRISPAALRDATRDLPLWSEAWQRFVAPRDPDGIVRCLVKRNVTRVDLRVRGVVYLGAALHGSGGVHRGVTLDHLTAWLARRRTERIPEHRRERWPVLVWATLTLSESGGFNAPAEDVEILRLTETT